MTKHKMTNTRQTKERGRRGANLDRRRRLSYPRAAFAVLALVNALCAAQEPPPLPVVARAGPSDLIAWDSTATRFRVTLTNLASPTDFIPPHFVTTNRIYAAILFNRLPDGTYTIAVSPVRNNQTFGEPALLTVVWAHADSTLAANVRVLPGK
jgi:hypothetical protein